MCIRDRLLPVLAVSIIVVFEYSPFSRNKCSSERTTSAGYFVLVILGMEQQADNNIIYIIEIVIIRIFKVELFFLQYLRNYLQRLV